VTGFVDLRSDTVTQPTPAMRRAMADAKVGDDGSREDPTVNELEELFAARVGKPASVFLPSGTMGNQVALRLLGVPGTRVVAGATSHVVGFEHGAAGINGVAQLHPIDDRSGQLDLAAARWAVGAAEHHWVPVSALFVENTHMAAGGVPWPLEALDEVVGLGLPVHLDGARLFNAEVATGISAATFAERATTLMCCLSKGLGAPVGSLIAGPAELMDQARHERKRLGGAMRQAGVLAAPGLVALRDHVDRLADDHARARRLGEAVAARWPGALDPETVLTNIVCWDHPAPLRVLAHLEAEGVLGGTLGPDRLRLVTHLDVDDDGIERACRALGSAP
jgi:threonine aldolase